ncbi:hypothetical protein OIV83_005577 [Microbotryomycetes sp. JL201]|nr:hypothetical protein OIV83_005577 [Microbotryomycetes sp. JL201]
MATPKKRGRPTNKDARPSTPSGFASSPGHLHLTNYDPAAGSMANVLTPTQNYLPELQAPSPEVSHMFDMLFPTFGEPMNEIQQPSPEMLEVINVLANPTTELTLPTFPTTGNDVSAVNNATAAPTMAYLTRIHAFLPLLGSEVTAVNEVLGDVSLLQAVLALAYGSAASPNDMDMISGETDNLASLQIKLFAAYHRFGLGKKQEALALVNQAANAVLAHNWHKLDVSDVASSAEDSAREPVRRLYWEARFLEGVLSHMLSAPYALTLAKSESVVRYPTEPGSPSTLAPGLRFRALDLLQQASLPWLFTTSSNDLNPQDEVTHLRTSIESLHVLAKDGLRLASDALSKLTLTASPEQLCELQAVVSSTKIASSMSAVAAIYLHTTFASSRRSSSANMVEDVSARQSACGPEPAMSKTNMTPHAVDHIFKWSSAIFNNMRQQQIDAQLADPSAGSVQALDGPCSSCQFLIAAVALTYSTYLREQFDGGPNGQTGTLSRRRQTVLTNLELAQHVCEKHASERWPVARESAQGIAKLRLEFV